MVTLKKAKVEDIKLIQDLAIESWTDTYAAILSIEQLTFMLAEMYSHKAINNQIVNQSNYHYHLIYIEEKAIGFVGFEHHLEADTTKLHRIYLIPKSKGLGAGKVGLNFVKSETQKSGNHRLILNVNKHNIALQFYQSQGFTIYEEKVIDIGNGYVMDDYLMEFNL